MKQLISVVMAAVGLMGLLVITGNLWLVVCILLIVGGVEIHVMDAINER